MSETSPGMYFNNPNNPDSPEYVRPEGAVETAGSPDSPQSAPRSSSPDLTRSHAEAHRKLDEIQEMLGKGGNNNG